MNMRPTLKFRWLWTRETISGVPTNCNEKRELQQLFVNDDCSVDAWVTVPVVEERVEMTLEQRQALFMKMGPAEAL